MNIVLPYSWYQSPVEMTVTFGDYDVLMNYHNLEKTTKPTNLTTTFPNQILRKCPLADWSQIGGREEFPPTADFFASNAYHRLFHAGERRLVYVGACSGLGWLARHFKLPIYMLSTTAPERDDERVYELKADIYAGVRLVDGRFVADLRRFDNWFASHIYVRQAAAPDGCVTIGARAYRHASHHHDASHV